MKASEINSVTQQDKILRAGLFGPEIIRETIVPALATILLGLGDILVRLLFKPEVLLQSPHPVLYWPGALFGTVLAGGVLFFYAVRRLKAAESQHTGKEDLPVTSQMPVSAERYRELIGFAWLRWLASAGGYIFTHFLVTDLAPDLKLSPVIFIALLTVAIILGNYLLSALTWHFTLYLVFGLLTTIVNLVFFRLSDELFNTNKIVCFAPWVLPQTISFIAAVLFAYVTNRIFVFRSKGPILPEILKFFAARLGCSLLFEYGGLYVLVDMLGMASFPAKIIVAILVILANYVLSKLVIFVGKKADR